LAEIVRLWIMTSAANPGATNAAAMMTPFVKLRLSTPTKNGKFDFTVVAA
jgi:hypothetical protein